MPINRSEFEQNGNPFDPIVNLPPSPPKTLFNRPIIQVENNISNFLVNNRNFAYQINEIMRELEGDIVSPIAGFVYSIALTHLWRKGSVEGRIVDGLSYYAIKENKKTQFY